MAREGGLSGGGKRRRAGASLRPRKTLWRGGASATIVVKRFMRPEVSLPRRRGWKAWKGGHMLKTSVRNRGFTLVELLVVIAIISILAGFLIPTIMKARGQADKAKCQSNLRELQKLGMIYADSAGTRFYPMGKGTNPQAHQSLNEIVKTTQGLKPDLFVCPSWREGTAEVVDEKFELEENTCSYAWPKHKVSPSDPPNTAVSCDKFVFDNEAKNGHADGRNVVYLDSSVDWVPTTKVPAEELPKGLTR
jgi:prepilin-type N-terminal cleavage/methylation domain-containing protein